MCDLEQKKRQLVEKFMNSYQESSIDWNFLINSYLCILQQRTSRKLDIITVMSFQKHRHIYFDYHESYAIVTI